MIKTGMRWIGTGWMRTALWIALAFTIGWWAGHPAQQVRAQSSNLTFQFESLNPNSALSIYYPDRQTIYIYQPAAVGSSNVNCAFYFQLGAPGETVKRLPCKAPSFQP